MRKFALRAACAALVPVFAVGCSWTGSAFTNDKVQYETTDTRTPLEVPPDLTQLPRDDRFAVPDRPQTVTASSLAQQAPVAGTTGAPQTVLPATTLARIERQGNQRWLAVNLPPEKVWPVLVDFWPSVGLKVEKQDAAAGTLETNWAENRAKLPQDIIRKTLGRVLDSVYSTGEQDMYRARAERAPNGTTEIFLSHRGMVEVYTTTAQDTTKWQPRPADPEMEAEMLARLAQRFDTTFNVAKPTAAVAGAASAAPAVAAPQMASLVRGKDGKPTAVTVAEPFDRAWRRVGLALDRVGFAVEDRARDQGIYFVRYLDPDYEAKAKDNQGLIAKMFGKEKPVEAPQYRVLVAADGVATRVTVAGKDGKPEVSPAGERILTLISEQLR
ncbi:MAG: outer membrane protein assembly factor BamC [Burkholderiaceae bacterium]